MKVHILDTAFIKYLRSVELYEAARHIQDCFIKGQGDPQNMVWELAEHFKCYEPFKLARMLHSKINKMVGKEEEANLNNDNGTRGHLLPPKE